MKNTSFVGIFLLILLVWDLGDGLYDNYQARLAKAKAETEAIKYTKRTPLIDRIVYYTEQGYKVKSIEFIQDTLLNRPISVTYYPGQSTNDEPQQKR